MDWQSAAAETVESFGRAVGAAARSLAARASREGRVAVELLDRHQEAAYQLAFLAAEARAAESMAGYGELGEVESLLGRVALAELVRSARGRLWGRELGVPEGLLAGGAAEAVLEEGSRPEVLDDLAAALEASGDSGPRRLPEAHAMLAGAFRRFAEERIAPHAQEVHRRDLDVPEEIIAGLAEMGAFGLSVPERYGGQRAEDEEGFLAMVVATEELSRASLAIGGSLITRPEMLVRALLTGGTEEQRHRWLPAIASGERMVAVAVTEPDHGSDVAGIRTMALPHEGDYVLRGAKTWCTFAGRAELLMLLARTHPDLSLGHRGLSLFVVEKPAASGKAFALEGRGGGRMEGRAIDTLGYRGLHSFALTLDDWRVPPEALVGGPGGEGRGFYLQMAAFETGRLQTAGRAVGVMEGALGEALGYAGRRVVFGRRLLDHPLSRARLARMAAALQAARRLAYRAAAGGEPALPALAKLLACRVAEAVARDAQQLHGGYGYAEEYPVARHFVDARVLSIFEGAEEVLAVRVIARRLAEEQA